MEDKLKIETHDEQITAIFEAINQLLIPPQKPKHKIEFSIKESKILVNNLNEEIK
ncbi:MAG: hypothetical protein JW995_06430 [Melioribacteraceae bacterium]|nr:hypothetical protein [Melioribacteraceae bacterium]